MWNHNINAQITELTLRVFLPYKMGNNAKWKLFSGSNTSASHKCQSWLLFSHKKICQFVSVQGHIVVSLRGFFWTQRVTVSPIKVVKNNWVYPLYIVCILSSPWLQIINRECLFYYFEVSLVCRKTISPKHLFNHLFIHSEDLRS